MMKESCRAPARVLSALQLKVITSGKHDDNHLHGKIKNRFSYLAKSITKKRFNIKTRRYDSRFISVGFQLSPQPFSVLSGSEVLANKMRYKRAKVNLPNFTP